MRKGGGCGCWVRRVREWSQRKTGLCGHPTSIVTYDDIYSIYLIKEILFQMKAIFHNKKFKKKIGKKNKKNVMADYKS